MPTPIPPSGRLPNDASLPADAISYPKPGELPKTSLSEKPHPQTAANLREQILHHALADSMIKKVFSFGGGNLRSHCALYHVDERLKKADNRDLAELGLLSALAIGVVVQRFIPRDT